MWACGVGRETTTINIRDTPFHKLLKSDAPNAFEQVPHRWRHSALFKVVIELEICGRHDHADCCSKHLGCLHTSTAQNSTPCKYVCALFSPSQAPTWMCITPTSTSSVAYVRIKAHYGRIYFHPFDINAFWDGRLISHYGYRTEGGKQKR